jgi:nuclear transcription factor Y gamma
MISAEAPILFAKACELFIMDITYRALLHTNLSKRKTLQRSDIAATISHNDMFDFLIDIIPREETDKEFLAKRDNEKASLVQMYRFSPKNIYPLPTDSNALMKNPLYGNPGAQHTMKRPLPPMMTGDNFPDLTGDLDNQDNKSLTNWSTMGANRNKSFQHNPI